MKDKGPDNVNGAFPIGVNMAELNYINIPCVNSLGTIEYNQVSLVPNSTIKEKENTMRMCDIPTLEAAQKDYFFKRLDTLYLDKNEALQIKYGLTDDEPPRSLQELMDRLNSGRYSFLRPSLDKDSSLGVYSLIDEIRWRDPNLKEDRNGFDKALDSLEKARSNSKDRIMASSTTDEYLNTLKEFESTVIN